MHEFDAAVQKANRWVKEMAGELGTDDAHEAYKALRAGLHALRDRLSVDEAVQLGAQLPVVIRGAYYDGWKPSGRPVHAHTVDDFVALVARRAPLGLPWDARAVIEALFRVLTRHLSPGETDAVMHVLSAPIVRMWTEAVRAH